MRHSHAGAAHSRIPSAGALRAQLSVLIAPLAALSYPFILTGFNASVTTITKSDVGVLPWLTAAVSLLLAFAAPTIALLAAMHFAEIRQPTVAQLRAKRMALLAVAAPTLFTFIGVVLSMLGDPVPDMWFWVACWVLAIVAFFRTDRNAPAPAKVQPVPAALRVAHGKSALVIIGIFLALHISNHLTGLVGPSTYDAVMKIFRYVYRTEVLQPLLVTLFLFQIGTGLYLVWRHTAAPSDRFRTFQIASGVYLAFYVLSHMNSVFIFARTYLGIDTDWNFATGAPTGLIKDPWNIRLVPYYWLGVFFVLSHIAVGTRTVMMAHGASKAFADRFMIGGAVTAGIIATAIMLGMCGLRLQFV
jgi:hypothetical protein